MGRTREFNKDEILLKTMNVFWENGFHSTSLENLMEATNLNKQSLYTAFGDKRSLFIKGLELYTETMVKELEDKILNKKSPFKAISKALLDITKTDEDICPKGCLAARTASEFGNDDKEILKIIEGFSERSEKIIATAIHQAQECNEIINKISAGDIAKHLMTTVYGIQLLKQRSASEKDLRLICKTALELIENKQTRKTR